MMRFGHAFWLKAGGGGAADVAHAVDLLRGTALLAPRTPGDSEAVERAEQVLGIVHRPIYAFAGCLHPKLGVVGLVISSSVLERGPHGSSRCDTGGLAGRRGAFAHLSEHDIETDLLRLSYPSDQVGWVDDLEEEVRLSYSRARDYVDGLTPDYAGWIDDPRARCLRCHNEASDGPLDRRLWTWEVRLSEPPTADDYEGLVVSAEMSKQLEQLRENGKEVPVGIKIVRGRVEPDGVHYFHEAAAAELLCDEVTNV